MAKKVQSPYVLTAKEAKSRARKIAKSRALNAKGNMSVRMQRQMVKDMRIAMGENVKSAKYDLR